MPDLRNLVQKPKKQKYDGFCHARWYGWRVVWPHQISLKSCFGASAQWSRAGILNDAFSMTSPSSQISRHFLSLLEKQTAPFSHHVVFFFARLWFRVFHCGPFMGAYGGKSRNRDHNFTKGNLCKFCCLRRGVGWWGRPQPALRFAIDIAFVTS